MVNWFKNLLFRGAFYSKRELLFYKDFQKYRYLWDIGLLRSFNFSVYIYLFFGKLLVPKWALSACHSTPRGWVTVSISHNRAPAIGPHLRPSCFAPIAPIPLYLPDYRLSSLPFVLIFSNFFPPPPLLFRSFSYFLTTIIFSHVFFVFRAALRGLLG